MKFSAYFFSADDNDRVSYRKRYQFILDTARRLDRAGFNAVLTPERHFQEFGGSFPNPCVLAAAIAAVTERIKIRCGSVVVPLHHPVRIAEEWAMVDQISGGRAEMTYATGWHRADFLFSPAAYDNRREITYESIRIIERLWRGESVEFPGPTGTATPVRSFPTTYRAGVPLPGWLVYSSNPQTWVKAGEMGLGVLTLFDNAEVLKTNIGLYRQSLRAAGFGPEHERITVALHSYIGYDEDRVRTEIDGAMRRYLGAFLNQRSADDRLRKERKTAAMSDRERAMILDLTLKDYYENRSLLGTPEKCRRIVQQLAQFGVTEIACMVDFGLDFEAINQAMPHLIALKKSFEDSSAVSADKPRDVAAAYFASLEPAQA